MAIRVHVACDDASYRGAIAALLAEDADLEVADTSREAEPGVAVLDDVKPDVVVLAVPPGEDVAAHTRLYREAAPESTRLVGFCTLEEQAEAYRRAGICDVVYAADTADALCEKVKAARA